jgi:preprotein translocase subunit YajC
MTDSIAPVLVLTVIAIVFVLFWVLVALPQKRARQTQQEIVKNLKVGEQVVTVGGLIGKLTYLDEEKDMARIEIAPGVEVRVIPAAISHPLDIMRRLDNAQAAAESKSGAAKPSGKTAQKKKS